MHFAVAPAFSVSVDLTLAHDVRKTHHDIAIGAELGKRKLNCHFSGAIEIVLINCCHQIKLNATFTFHQPRRAPTTCPTFHQSK